MRARLVLVLALPLLLAPLLGPSCNDLTLSVASPEIDETVCVEDLDVVVDLSRSVNPASVVTATLVEGVDSVPTQSDVSAQFSLDGQSLSATLPLSSDGRNFLSLHVDENGDGTAEAYTTVTFQRDVVTEPADECGVCGGDGTGEIGCPGNCGGIGTCACDVCICPDPLFGASCACNPRAAAYNGLFQHSFINGLDATNMDVPFTVEIWVYMDSPGDPLVLRSGPTNTQWSLSMGIVGQPAAPNYLRISNGQPCGTCTVDGNVLAATSRWNHVAFTWDPVTSTVAFFLNGSAAGGGVFTPGSLGTGVTQLALEGSTYFGGVLDEFRVWDYVRTESEIAQTMNVELKGYEAGLMVNNHFNKWTASDAESVDSTPNHNHVVHSLFVSQETSNVPPVVETDDCPNDCGGSAGDCACGVCTCVSPADDSFDCSLSGGGA